MDSIDNYISYSYVYGAFTLKNTDVIEHTYSYLDDGKLSSYSISGNFTATATYTYDSLDRVIEVEYNNSSMNEGEVRITESYEYVSDSSYGESGLVSKYTSTVLPNTESYTYTYDKNGNITKIRYSSGKTIEYTYNDLGWLIEEDNDITYKVYTYSYNNAGNIVRITETEKTQDDGFIQMGVVGDSNAETLALSPTLPLPAAVSYICGYTDSVWGDLLTSFNGTTITYDEIGNPISYYNGSSYTFEWQGRELISATKGGVDYAYAYNSNGLRISKTKNANTANAVTTHYVYDGDILIAEYTNSETIVYIYDAYDSPIGFKYKSNSYASDTWDVYWYGKNAQGDILYIYDDFGTKLASYTYNAWGKTTISYSGSGASTTAVKNNLTYRGYYYDSDLAMYYLQSRYYDPVICRFINTDIPDVITASPTALTDKNLFAYCDNNPVMRVDEDGEFWHILVGAVVGGLISGAVSAASQWLTSGEVNMDEVWVSAAAGAISGALATTGIGAIGSGIINAAVDGLEYMAIQTINGEEIDNTELFATMFISSVTAGKGMNGAKMREIYKHSNTVLKTAISETKKQLYKDKKKDVIKKIGKGVADEIFDGAFSIGWECLDNKYNIKKNIQNYLGVR